MVEKVIVHRDSITFKLYNGNEIKIIAIKIDAKSKIKNS